MFLHSYLQRLYLVLQAYCYNLCWMSWPRSARQSSLRNLLEGFNYREGFRRDTTRQTQFIFFTADFYTTYVKHAKI